MMMKLSQFNKRGKKNFFSLVNANDCMRLYYTPAFASSSTSWVVSLLSILDVMELISV